MKNVLLNREGGLKALAATAALWIAAGSLPTAASPAESLPAGDSQAPAAFTNAALAGAAEKTPEGGAADPPKKNWFARAADYLRFHAQRLFTKQDQAEAKAADYEQKASRYQEAADFQAETRSRQSFFQRIAAFYKRAAGLWRKQADKNRTAAKVYEKKAKDYEYLSLPEDKRLARKTAECLHAAQETLKEQEKLRLLKNKKTVRVECPLISGYYPDNDHVFLAPFPSSPAQTSGCSSYGYTSGGMNAIGVSGIIGQKPSRNRPSAKLSLAEKRAKLQDCQNKLKALAPKVMNQCRDSLNGVLKDLKTRDLTAEGTASGDIIECNPPYPYKYDSNAFWKNSFEGQIQCFNKRKSPIDFVSAAVDMELNAENKLERTQECVRFLEDSKIKLAESRIDSLDEKLKTCLIKKGAARQAALKEMLKAGQAVLRQNANFPHLPDNFYDIDCPAQEDWIISRPGPGTAEARNVTCRSGVSNIFPATITLASAPVSCPEDKVRIQKTVKAAPAFSSWEACVQDAVRQTKRKLTANHRPDLYTCQGHYGSSLGYRVECRPKEGDRANLAAGYQPYPAACDSYPGRPSFVMRAERAPRQPARASGSSGLE